MASSEASRQVDACALSNEHGLRIDMRAQSRITLAPEEGGGHPTAERTAPRLSSIIVDLTTTCIIEFAKLLA
eukprot:6194310-Pleurochrysis_carterae.AAC.3